MVGAHDDQQSECTHRKRSCEAVNEKHRKLGVGGNGKRKQAAEEQCCRDPAERQRE